MKSIPILNAIGKSTDITSEIIRRCEKILKYDEEYKKVKEEGNGFTSIIVYEDPYNINEPCFQVNSVIKMVKPNEQHIPRILKKNFRLGKHYFKAKLKDDNRDPSNIFSRRGVMKYMFQEKTQIAEVFQDYVFELLDGLWKRQKELMRLEMKNTDKLLEEEREKRREAERINEQNIEIADAIYNTDNREQDILELNVLRRRLMTRYYVYLVDWKLVNAKYWKNFPPEENKIQPRKKRDFVETQTIFEGIELNSSGDDEPQPQQKRTNTSRKKLKQIDVDKQHPKGLNEYEFIYTDINDIKRDENIAYYICITDKQIKKEGYKFLQYLYLDKSSGNVHYKSMVDIILNGEKCNSQTAYKLNGKDVPVKLYDMEVESAETPIKKVYKITYSELINARDRGFVTNNLQVIKTLQVKGTTQM